jgi:hypothetical protein
VVHVTLTELPVLAPLIPAPVPLTDQLYVSPVTGETPYTLVEFAQTGVGSVEIVGAAGAELLTVALSVALAVAEHALVTVTVIVYEPEAGAVTETLVTAPLEGLVVIVAPVAAQLYVVAPLTPVNE